jgi:predicted DNA-binding transcriptional regulator AlpA
MKKHFKRPPPPRTRPVKGAAAQVEPALKAANLFATSHAGQPPPNMVPANKRFIYKPEVLERVGKTFVTIWRWMGEGKFPTARAVGGQIAWLESDIDEWMSSRPLRQYKSREVA